MHQNELKLKEAEITLRTRERDAKKYLKKEEGEKYQENGVFIKKFLIKCKNCLYQTRDERNDPKVFLNNIKFIQSDSLIGKLFDIKSLLSSSN